MKIYELLIPYFYSYANDLPIHLDAPVINAVLINSSSDLPEGSSRPQSYIRMHSK